MRSLSVPLFAILLLSCSQSVQVSVNTPIPGRESIDTNRYQLIADALNEQITNARATLDKSKGILTITFDYPSQLWNSVNGRPFPPPEGFLIRLADKNRNVLTFFVTEEVFIADAIGNNAEAIDAYRRAFPNRLVRLQSAGNVLSYPVNETIIRDVAMVEFGFNYSSRYICDGRCTLIRPHN